MSLIKSILSRSDTGKKLLLFRNLHGYFEEIDWSKSVAEGLPVDRSGNCLPWLTYPAITFLNGKLQSDMTVFEYGSGNSTLWWSHRVSSVVSYEHDLVWYSSMKKRVPSNVDYRHCDLEYGGEYCKAILRYSDRFNIVVIDGRDRVNCAKNSIGALRGNGVVVWDNSGRDAYQEGYSYRGGPHQLDS